MLPHTTLRGAGGSGHARGGSGTLAHYGWLCVRGRGAGSRDLLRGNVQEVVTDKVVRFKGRGDGQWRHGFCLDGFSTICSRSVHGMASCRWRGGAMLVPCAPSHACRWSVELIPGYTTTLVSAVGCCCLF